MPSKTRTRPTAKAPTAKATSGSTSERAARGKPKQDPTHPSKRPIPMFGSRSTAARINALQALLIVAGEQAEINGQWDNETERAVDAFHARHGVKAGDPGVVTPHTLELLAGFLAAP